MVQTVSIPVRYQLELFQDARGTKMERYINAGELLEDLKHVYCLSCKKVNTFYCWNTCDVSDIINDVLSYEPADVVPVVHAHWIPQSRLKHILYYLQTGQDLCSCSNCTSCGNKLMRHCPTCGAKMDEEEGQR